MHPALSIPLTAFAGLCAWTLLEYLIHGVLCHRLDTPAGRLHWTHHRDPARVFTPLGVWAPAAALLAALSALVAGPLLGGAFTSGALLGFGAYERQHWRFHFRAPRSPREARARAHHLCHHFVNPKAYHGVTTAFWDRAFGTLPDRWEEDHARVADRVPLKGASNLGQLW